MFIFKREIVSAAFLSYKYNRGCGIKAAPLLGERKPTVFSIHEFPCLLRGSLEDLETIWSKRQQKISLPIDLITEFDISVSNVPTL